MKLSFKEFLTEEESRRDVMKKIRKVFDLGAEQTYSEPQKGQRMVKLYNIKVEDGSNVAKAVKAINEYIKDQGIKGVTARMMKTGMASYRRGTKSIAFMFDNKVYGE